LLSADNLYNQKQNREKLENFRKTKMIFSDEDKKLIKIYLLKGYRPVKLMTEFLGRNWKRDGLDKLLNNYTIYSV